MKKTETIMMRVTPETKQKIFQEAIAEGICATDYILKRVNRSLPCHEEHVASYMPMNTLMNTLRNQPELKQRHLDIIEKELEKLCQTQD